MIYVLIGAAIVFSLPLLATWLELNPPPLPEGPRDQEALRIADEAGRSPEAGDAQQFSLARHQWINGIALAVLIPGIVVIPMLLGLLFYWLYLGNLSQLPPSEFVFPPLAPALAAIFSGIFLAIFVIALVVRVLLGLVLSPRTLVEYYHWEQAKAPFSRQAMTRLKAILFLGVGIPAAALFVQGLNCYQRADDNCIAVRGILSLWEEVYPLGDITRLAVSTKRWKSRKQQTTEPAFEVHIWMADGRVLELSYLGEDQGKRFLDWLRLKTGKEAENVGLPEEVGR
jgi:hypothetical protein